MFKLIQDTSDLSSTKSFETIEGLFDPRQNRLFATGEQRTMKGFLTVLRSIYTRDNILGNLSYFFRTSFHYGARDPSDFLWALIQSIPDEFLYLLHFCQVGGVSFEDRPRTAPTETWVCSLQWYDFAPLCFRSGASHAPTCWDPAGSEGIAFSGTIADIVANLVIPRLETVRALYDAYYTTVLEEKYQNYQNLTPANDHFLTDRLIKYWSNCALYKKGDAHYSPTDILILLESSAGKIIVNEQRDGFGNTPTSFTLFFRETATKTNRHCLYLQMNYTASPLHYIEWPIIQKGEDNPLIYGVELELSTRFSIEQLVDAAEEPFFIIKHDGSVNGALPFFHELATVPMSLKAHRWQWAYWYRSLGYENFDTSTETNNGMHVHISQSAFVDAAHRRKFTWFFINPIHKDLMFQLSERTKASFDQYTPVPNFADRNQGYSKARLLVQSERWARSAGRGLVNFSNKGTIEIRLFRGIVSYATIMKNLEVVDAVYFFTKNVSYNDITLSKFFAWLQEQPKNRYIALKKFLSRLNVSQIVTAADLREAIFLETDPEEIVSILTKKKYPLTSTHIAILNKSRKKRTFVLDDGILRVINLDRGKIASFDKTLEDRLFKGKITPSTQATVLPPPPPELSSHYDDNLNEEETHEIDGGDGPYYNDEYIEPPPLEQPAPARRRQTPRSMGFSGEPVTLTLEDVFSSTRIRGNIV